MPQLVKRALPKQKRLLKASVKIGNKEAIIKVIEVLKGQDNLTLCRTIETLFFLVPAQMVIAVMESLKYHLKVRTLSILKESLSELLKGKEEKEKEDE